MTETESLGVRRFTTHPLRHVAERLSRGVSLKRRLPARVGGRTIWTSPEGSSLRAWKRDSEAIGHHLFDVAARLVRPGDVVWDIGANVGYFSFAAAYLAGAQGKVVAVEPDTFVASLLRRSAGIPHAGSAPVQVVPVAASDETALAHFHIANRARSANFLAGHGSTQASGSREMQVVMTVTLDWLLQQLKSPPNVLKIDVEGAELLVLDGACEVLASHPSIFIEVASENARTVTDILQAHYYELFDAEAGGSQPLSSAAWSTIALPQRESGCRMPPQTT